MSVILVLNSILDPLSFSSDDKKYKVIVFNRTMKIKVDKFGEQKLRWYKFKKMWSTVLNNQ